MERCRRACSRRLCVSSSLPPTPATCLCSRHPGPTSRPPRPLRSKWTWQDDMASLTWLAGATLAQARHQTACSTPRTRAAPALAATARGPAAALATASSSLSPCPAATAPGCSTSSPCSSKRRSSHPGSPSGSRAWAGDGRELSRRAATWGAHPASADRLQQGLACPRQPVVRGTEACIPAPAPAALAPCTANSARSMEPRSAPAAARAASATVSTTPCVGMEEGDSLWVSLLGQSALAAAAAVRQGRQQGGAPLR